MAFFVGLLTFVVGLSIGIAFKDIIMSQVQKLINKK